MDLGSISAKGNFKMWLLMIDLLSLRQPGSPLYSNIWFF